jgi:hypothetical protein
MEKAEDEYEHIERHMTLRKSSVLAVAVQPHRIFDNYTHSQ